MNTDTKAEQETLPTSDTGKYYKANMEAEAKANEAQAQILINDRMKRIAIRNRFNKND